MSLHLDDRHVVGVGGAPAIVLGRAPRAAPRRPAPGRRGSYRALRMISRPPMTVAGHQHTQDRGARPVGVGERQRQQCATRGAEEEHVDRAHRRAEAAQAVRHDRLQQRTDHRERRRQQHDLGDAEQREQHGVGHEVLHRREQRCGQREQADAAAAPAAGSRAEQAVVVATDERDHDEAGQSTDGRHADRGWNAVEAELLLEEQVDEHRQR